MKTVGKVLLFIGGLLFFVSAILDTVVLAKGIVASPAAYFGSGTAVVSFLKTLLWILAGLAAGYYGMMYALKGKHFVVVSVVAWIILVLFALSLIDSILAVVESKSFAWSAWSVTVYGGLAGALYCVGYFLEAKKK